LFIQPVYELELSQALNSDPIQCGWDFFFPQLISLNIKQTSQYNWSSSTISGEKSSYK